MKFNIVVWSQDLEEPYVCCLVGRIFIYNIVIYNIIYNYILFVFKSSCDSEPLDRQTVLASIEPLGV